MTRSIIPLPMRRDGQSPLADLDRTAAALLAEGRVATLSAARISVLLTKIRGQRAELAAVIADLQTRAPTGDMQLDAANADLGAQANIGLAQIDRLIQLVEACAVTPSSLVQP